MGKEVVWHFVWILLVTTAISYAAYLFFGSFVAAETEKPLNEVDVYDLIDRAQHTHRLSGILMVPTACHSISVVTKKTGVGMYQLSFSSFGDAHGCAQDPQPRAFRAVISAPILGNTFTASFDGKPLDFRIVSSNYLSD